MKALNGAMDEFTKRTMSQPGQDSGITLTEQQRHARRTRSIAIALALGVFVVVMFAVTMVKLGSAVLTRPM
jgi:hypothetical protein